MNYTYYDPRFRSLTPAVLRELPDGELLDAIYDHAVLRMGEDLDPEPELVALLPEGVRAVWAAMLFDVIMGSGGFNLFFWDAAEPSAEHTLAGLRNVGAEDQATLLNEAMDAARVARSRLAPYRVEGSEAAWRASFSERVFRSLDSRYWTLPDLKQILIVAVRRNPERFCCP